MQQINLYQSELRSKEKTVSANKAISYVLGMLALVAVISTVQWWQQSRQQQVLVEARQQKDELLKQIQAVTNEIAAMSDDSEYKKVLLDKEQELNNKQLVLGVLSGQKFGNTKGFAEHFTGLARQHINGLWLTHLDIHAGGEKLNIQGSTFTPEYVPRYLQNLSGEPSFQGIEFKTFLMERQQGSSRVDFSIRSTHKESS